MGLKPAPLDRPVVVTVDALELRGFSAGRRFAVAAAFQRELGRLFRTRGVPEGLLQRAAGAAIEAPRRGSEPAAAPGPAVMIDPSGPAWLAGRAIARAVYRGLG
jgi:hypothetical protein